MARSLLRGDEVQRHHPLVATVGVIRRLDAPLDTLDVERAEQLARFIRRGEVQHAGVGKTSTAIDIVAIAQRIARILGGGTAC